MLAFLAGIKLKLAMGLALLASVAFIGLYIQHLRDKNSNLELQKSAITKERDNLESTIVEINRRQDVVETVTVHMDKIRAKNRIKHETQLETIDDQVNQGQDREIGPLLKEFLNEK